VVTTRSGTRRRLRSIIWELDDSHALPLDEGAQQVDLIGTV
jgi:hypothetical protein